MHRIRQIRPRNDLMSWHRRHSAFSSLDRRCANWCCPSNCSSVCPNLHSNSWRMWTVFNCAHPRFAPDLPISTLDPLLLRNCFHFRGEPNRRTPPRSARLPHFYALRLQLCGRVSIWKGAPIEDFRLDAILRFHHMQCRWSDCLPEIDGPRIRHSLSEGRRLWKIDWESHQYCLIPRKIQESVHVKSNATSCGTD